MLVIFYSVVGFTNHKCGYYQHCFQFKLAIVIGKAMYETEESGWATLNNAPDYWANGLLSLTLTLVH